MGIEVKKKTLEQITSTPLYDESGELNLKVFLENSNYYIGETSSFGLESHCLEAICALESLYQNEQLGLLQKYGDFIENHATDKFRINLHNKLTQGVKIKEGVYLIADSMRCLKLILKESRISNEDPDWRLYSSIARRIGWLEHYVGINLDLIKEAVRSEAYEKGEEAGFKAHEIAAKYSAKSEIHMAPKYTDTPARDNWIRAMRASRIDNAEIMRLWNLANASYLLNQNKIDNAMRNGNGEKSKASKLTNSSLYNSTRVIGGRR